MPVKPRRHDEDMDFVTDEIIGTFISPLANPQTVGPAGDPDLAPFTHGLDLMGDRSMVLLLTLGHTPGFAVHAGRNLT